MEEPISKSQKKRDAAALQKMGVELIALPESKLDTLPLTPNLRHAIIAAKSITSHCAMRRQAQLIGKLMRSADSEAITAGFNEIMAEGSAQTAAFHEMEDWRSRLIDEGKEALTAFVEAHPQVDVRKLRQLVKKAVDEKVADKSFGASKALFRFLRSCLK
jgi:ribosome-associated protein